MGLKQLPSSSSADLVSLVAKSDPKNYLIPILGVDGAGKRTLLSTIFKSLPPPYSPPKSFNSASSIFKLIQSYLPISRLAFRTTPSPVSAEHTITTHVITLGLYFERATFRKNIDFVILDLAGCRKTQKQEQQLCKDAAGVIWVVDTADRQRMAESREELAMILRGLTSSKAPLVVLCNPIFAPLGEEDCTVSLADAKKPMCQQDMLDVAEVHRQLDRPEIVGNREWKCFEINAQKGSGLGVALDWFQGRLREEHPNIVLPSLPEMAHHFDLGEYKRQDHGICQ